MAQHLHAIQTGVNPGGLLAAIECRVGGRVALAILKLEREEGVRIAQSKVNGKRTFDLGLIKDLILTEKTKLFKIALFVLDTHRRLEGTACDQQRGFLPRVEIASFFLNSFLGCQLRMDPSVSTKHFFQSGEQFFNEAVSDPIDRRTYHTHLLSELTSNRTSIDPTDFANTYLKTEHRQPFLEQLAQGDIPVQLFPKDNTLIADRLKTTVMEFQSGIQLAGPQEAIKDKVSLTKAGEAVATDAATEGEEVQATFIDKLKRIRNR